MTGTRGGPAAAVVLLVVLGIAGCAAPRGTPTDPGLGAEALAARHDAALAAFERFRVRGGLGVWNDESSLSARVDWRQRGEALEVDLAAPLGLGTVRLARRDGRASLARGEAPPLVGDSAERLLQRALGLPVPVPLGQLEAWLRGLPGDGHDVRRDAAGRLRSLRWNDALGTAWQARVLRYTTFEGLDLPSLVTAHGAGYRLRLVLSDWSADVPDTESPAPPGEPLPARRPIPGR